MAAEEATRVLDRAFRENGLQGTPPDLERLLRGFRRKVDETAEQARRRFYRRVFGILWVMRNVRRVIRDHPRGSFVCGKTFCLFGNKVGEGQFRGKALPTYVYPDCLKEAIRTTIDKELRDYPNPETLAVYKVTLTDLFHARWPGDA